MDKEQSPIYLVKSSGRIYGPYYKEEVVRELYNHRISAIDEVRDPKTRWLFLRQHPEFSQALQFLRDQEITQSAIRNDDLTPTPITVAPASGVGSENKNDFTPTPEWEPVPEWTPPPMHVEPDLIVETKVQEKTYIPITDKKIQAQVKKDNSTSLRLAWISAILIFTVAVAFFVTQQREPARNLGYEDYLKLAKSNRSVGVYDKALNFYKKAESIKPLDSQNKIQMAALLMVVEQRNIEARSLLEESLQNLVPDASQKAEVSVLIALTYMREGQLDKAKEILLSTPSSDPIKSAVTINLVMLDMISEKYQNAYNEITKLIKEDTSQPLLVLMRSLAAFHVFNEKEGKDKILNSIEDLRRYLEKNKEYLLEGLLLQAAMYAKIGEVKESEIILRELFSQSPDLTRDHVHDLFIDRQIFEWSHLGSLCEAAYAPISETALGQTLKAYCYFQRQDVTSALDTLEKAQKQRAQEPALRDILAFILLKLKRTEEAKAFSKLSSDTKLDALITAELCMADGNWNCAEGSWKRALEKDSLDLVALHGLAMKYKEVGQKEMAMDFVRRGLLVSSRYRPLIEQKEQLDGQ